MINDFRCSFLEYSKNLCKETKFKRFGNALAYVQNDILFSFNPKRLSNKKYTLEFGALPLCMGLYFVDQGNFELRDLTFDCDFGTTDTDELRQYADKEIIPFFKSCENAVSALEAVKNLYLRKEALRADYLRRNGIEDKAKPIEERIYFQNCVFYFAMKALDFKTMIKCLSYKIPVSKEKIVTFEKETGRFVSEGKSEYASLSRKKAESEKEDYLYYTDLLNRAKERDVLFFLSETEKRENETKSRLPTKLFL